MGTKQNSIVLNGKIYDAVTGAIIHEPAAVPMAHKPKIHKNTGLVMDSVRRPAAKAHKVKSHSSSATHHARPAPHHVTKPGRAHTPAHAAGHKPRRAATLMRQSVAKPVHRDHHKEEAPKHPHDGRTARRLERAQTVQKSHHIKHFPIDYEPRKPVTKKHTPVKVEAAPAGAHHQAPVHPPAPMSESEKLVTHALKNARTHEANHPYAKKPKKRLAHAFGVKRSTANLAMGSLAALLLVGFFVYQNIPNLSMRVASTRAGFSATLPGYKPAGFAQDNLVSYGPGKVTISFHSNSDDRSFDVTQQVSNWNSQSLVENYLATNNKQYQTYEAGGKTIYIYDASSATWVNGGVWYQIEGKSSLTSDQLLKIANSI